METLGASACRRSGAIVALDGGWQPSSKLSLKPLCSICRDRGRLGWGAWRGRIGIGRTPRERGDGRDPARRLGRAEEVKQSHTPCPQEDPALRASLGYLEHRELALDFDRHARTVLGRQDNFVADSRP